MSEQGLRSFVARFRDNVVQSQDEPKESLDALAAANSTRCDAIIRAAEADEGLLFVGGTLAIALLRNREELEIRLKAYFQNARGEWVNRTNHQVYDLDVVLAAPGIAELLRVGRVEFELEQPAESTSRAALPPK